jgi:hypothetical protein
MDKSGELGKLNGHNTHVALDNCTSSELDHAKGAMHAVAVRGHQLMHWAMGM